MALSPDPGELTWGLPFWLPTPPWGVPRACCRLAGVRQPGMPVLWMGNRRRAGAQLVWCRLAHGRADVHGRARAAFKEFYDAAHGRINWRGLRLPARLEADRRVGGPVR